MPFEDARAHLAHIRDAIGSIQRFVEGMDLNAYAHDERSRAAVERKLLVISEAAIRLGGAAESVCPEVPWRDVRGIGNWLRHQYDRVDMETVWNTIQIDLPPLQAAIERALEAEEPGGSHSTTES